MRDISRLARRIQMDNMKMIAREQLEIDDTDIDNIAADCRDKDVRVQLRNPQEMVETIQ